MAAAARQDQEQVSRRYRLGWHVSVALYTLPSILGPLLTEFPELDISLSHDLSRRIVEEIVSLKLDLGLVVNPVRHPDLVVQRLLTDEVTLWTARKPTAQQNPRCGQAVLICDPDLLQT